MKVERQIYAGSGKRPYFRAELRNATIDIRAEKGKGIIQLSDYREDLDQREVVKISISEDELQKLLKDIMTLQQSIVPR